MRGDLCPGIPDRAGTGGTVDIHQLNTSPRWHDTDRYVRIVHHVPSAKSYAKHSVSDTEADMVMRLTIRLIGKDVVHQLTSGQHPPSGSRAHATCRMFPDRGIDDAAVVPGQLTDVACLPRRFQDVREVVELHREHGIRRCQERCQPADTSAQVYAHGKKPHRMC